jgi:putative phosphoribosyl transferase
MSSFLDRHAAGCALATEIQKNHPDLMNQPDTIVLGLPRGGIPVAFEVAKVIHAPLDAYVVRKLGTPGQEEFAMGALAMDGTAYLDKTLIKWLGINQCGIDQTMERERLELNRRAMLYRGSTTPPKVEGKKVLIVDDGLATGATMKAAIRAIKKNQPDQIMIAVPVAPPSTVKELAGEVDRLICLEEHEPFIGVGLWYSNFSQTTDNDVKVLLEKAASYSSVSLEATQESVMQSYQTEKKKRRHRDVAPI